MKAHPKFTADQPSNVFQDRKMPAKFVRVLGGKNKNLWKNSKIRKRNDYPRFSSTVPEGDGVCFCRKHTLLIQLKDQSIGAAAHTLAEDRVCKQTKTA